MALRLLGSKLSEVVPRHLVKKRLMPPPLAKTTTAPLERSTFGCPQRAKNLLHDRSSSSKAQAGFVSSFGRRNFSSGIPTENTRMNSSKKVPSGPGNEVLLKQTENLNAANAQGGTLGSSCALSMAGSSGSPLHASGLLLTILSR